MNDGKREHNAITGHNNNRQQHETTNNWLILPAVHTLLEFKD